MAATSTRLHDGPLPLMRQVRHFVLALIVVITTFGGYRLIAVPLIEPQVVPLTGRLPGPARQRMSSLPPHVAALFGPSDWESNRPKVLQTDRGMLIFDEHEPRRDGRMEIRPCTVVLFADEAAESRPIVLRAPGGAVLQFDQPFNLARGTLGQFLGGRLEGEISIRSPESEPGADDAFLAQTSAVEIWPDRIWTSQEVEFKFGGSRGRGRELLINLEEVPEKKNGMGIGKPVELDLFHVDEVVIEIPADKRLAVPAGQTRQPTSARLTCEGPFYFDFMSHVGTLSEQVRVVHDAAPGVIDTLHCDKIQIRLERSPDAAAEHDTAAKLTEILAEGTPAILEAPSSAVSARAAQIAYNFSTRTIRLEDPRRSHIAFQEHTAEGPRLTYQMSPVDPRRLGELEVIGAGWYRGKLADRDEWLEAEWRDHVTLQPQGNEHVFSLVGQAALRMSRSGRFQADQLHVWLREEPATAATLEPGTTAADRPVTNYQIRPERLRAEDAIEFDSQPLSGRTRLLEAWFEFEDGPQSTVTPDDTRSDPLAQRPGVLIRPGGAAPHEPPRHYHVEAGVVRMQLLFVGGDTVVRQAQLLEQVQIAEIPRGNLPSAFQLAGSSLDWTTGVDGLSDLDVVGQPARIQLRGLQLEGDALHLSQREARMWMDGPGSMVLPAKRDTRTGTTISPVNITWNSGMNFDGRTAAFRADVHARTTRQLKSGEQAEIDLRSREMLVELTQTIDFSRPQKPENVDVRHLRFPGQVHIQNHTRDLQRNPTSLDSLHVRDLVVEHTAGTFYSQGPGEGESTRFDREDRDGFAVGGPPAAESQAAARRQLVYLHVDFQGGMTGNFQVPEVRFQQDVRAVYGPVRDWQQRLNPNRPDLLGPRGIMLNCDELVVSQVQGPEERFADLKAISHVRVGGRQFSAIAHRLSYSQAKDMLTLAGDGRTPAQIMFRTDAQSQPSTVSAGTIQYSPGTGQLHSANIRDLNFYQNK